ncbi:hypothetical protein [Methylobacterium frigidaeris]|uniref:Uncharacterized protein n=1 Tax=Methylobacterium frigidaeris TaxID=2038277 RepID=A0AA37HI21_9HYPH|nr:hypothetical protein [Methylobacterium frigidaeris]GJD65916.1 hypothetical protein MPEAHAMD_6112 [Methylobacterium frigidaeris]
MFTTLRSLKCRNAPFADILSVDRHELMRLGCFPPRGAAVPLEVFAFWDETLPAGRREEATDGLGIDPNAA